MLTRVATKSGSKKPYRSEQLQGVGNFFNSLSYAAMTQSWAEEMTLEKLEEKTVKYFSERMNSEPNIYWEGFFEQIFQGTDIEISPTTVVSLPFDKVMQVLQSVKYADTKAVANALNFQLATQLLLESTGVLDDLNTFKCTESNLPKEVLCLEKTKEYFGYSLGTTYLNVYYNDAVTTPAITSLMDKIKQGYQDVIDDTKWMENKTKAYLKDKIQDMTTFITKPDWLKENGGLENFYQGLQVANNMRSSYPMNFLRVNNWYVAKTRSYTNRITKIQESGDLSDFHIYDLSMSRYLGTVQAQFHPMINEARIEGGIVQKPLFGANRPGFMNFGGLGMVLAHEVGHSFDTKGRNYDKNGKSGEFWDPVSVKNYNDWVQTLASDAGSVAYQTSETSAETIDPYKTLNEDIADVLAVYISYFSYQEYLKELEANGKHEKVLPGLKTFEPQKLFFMKYANMWCDKKDTQSMYADMQSIHSAGNTRATLPLKRSKQFAEAFGCKIPKQY
ncbi:Endothelin-converting enzyme 2 [Orchesella cincta]|uniref:Endothelin-converting enzyme 2 n=1 Tax=Orchesella cincta TaxID=48709 RepID=A0A1D2MEY0_ORCCI|nr:Endothelin-converting enzyme 2 [Orchesella cincta]